ncbi:transporter substrate-binding domain-containing protein [Mesorhizobium sp. M0991]|uniref:transporter substrate-binding domain-containing protein n=1 Tax=Mesorhizobium sp. M0991 TaxID=2957043 RepID=UPI0033369DCE
MNKLMTMIAATASLAVVSAASVTAANAGEVLDRVLETKTLTVAAGVDWGVESRLNDKHELEGYDIDVAKGIADYLGVEAKFVTPEWGVIVSGKWEGRWDLAAGEMVPTKARTDLFDFPAIYFYGKYVVLVPNDSKADKLSDLNGKIIGADANGPAEKYASQTLTPDWPGAKPIKYQFTPGSVKLYESGSISMADLRLGDGVRLNAHITAGSTAQGAIESGFPVHQLGDPLFFVPGALAVLPGDKKFSDKIAAAIQKMRDDGTLSKLAIKWYGYDASTEQ